MEPETLAIGVYREIGRAIARERRKRVPRLTQAGLAKLTKKALSRSAIANIESGRQRVAVHHLFELALALQVEPASLLPSMESVADKNQVAVRRFLSTTHRKST